MIHASAVGSDRRIRSIAIVGGGTAGWLAASVLARVLTPLGVLITVVESAEIGTIGVGEATIPPIIDLLGFLGIDVSDFVRHTGATYKLGIKFSDWGLPGESYWHPFGTFGDSLYRRPFHHLWHRARAAGVDLRFNDCSPCAALAEAGRFRFPDAEAGSSAAGLRFALHFDATLVAPYLRGYAERLGVRRIEATVAGATRGGNGLIEELRFSDRPPLAADLYIDCSGFRGVLIEQTLGTGYCDWTTMLPCDRAVAFPTQVRGARPPYTQAVARSAGWHWHIPLQHRVGNGYVYSSAHCDESQALQDLTEVAGAPQAEPRVLRFVTGRRRMPWHGNCVAIGLASGFLEPLESTSIHLATSGLYHLLEHFPDRDFDRANIAAYNARVIEEVETVRDFIVLHYHLTRRDDSSFWRDCRAINIPDTLRERIELYRGSGRIRARSGDLFSDLSWFYIFEGLRLRPARSDPLLDGLDAAQLRSVMARLASATARTVQGAAPHDSFFQPAAACKISTAHS